MILEAHPKATVALIRSGGGVLEIKVDGRLAYSKKATGDFPTEAEILAACS